MEYCHLCDDVTRGCNFHLALSLPGLEQESGYGDGPWSRNGGSLARRNKRWIPQFCIHAERTLAKHLWAQKWLFPTRATDETTALANTSHPWKTPRGGSSSTVSEPLTCRNGKIMNQVHGHQLHSRS